MNPLKKITCFDGSLALIFVEGGLGGCIANFVLLFVMSQSRSLIIRIIFELTIPTWCNLQNLDNLTLYKSSYPNNTSG
jgi:hypothetical protein